MFYAWTFNHAGSPMYVSALPGDGGVDWGFGTRIEGVNGYDKALPLSERQLQRFAKRQRDMRQPCHSVAIA